LGAVLAVELLRWRDRGLTETDARVVAERGGLAAWQEGRLRDYTEDNLVSAMSLDDWLVRVGSAPSTSPAPSRPPPRCRRIAK
jgi:hypothetical protein